MNKIQSNAPVLLLETVWAETVKKRVMDGRGLEYRVPEKRTSEFYIKRKPVPYWLLDSESPYSKAGVQPDAFLVVDSYTTKEEEFPLRYPLDCDSIQAEKVTESRLRKLANRISRIF